MFVYYRDCLRSFRWRTGRIRVYCLFLYVTRLHAADDDDGDAIDVLVSRRREALRFGGKGGDKPGPAQAALLVEGVVFALSVLTLFYFMTLMLFEESFTGLPQSRPSGLTRLPDPLWSTVW